MTFSFWRCIVGERLHDITTGVDKILVQAGDDLGVLKHHLRYEGAGLKVTTAFELKEITFRADDRTGVEPFQ
jgi:hypothetical protein